MKNKDGIEIRVGQVWESTTVCEYEIIAKHNNKLVLANGGIYFPLYEDQMERIFHRLIFCPVLGDMSEWDVVTDEQKEKYICPFEAEFFDEYENWEDVYAGIDNFNGCRSVNNDGWSDNDTIYRVPRDFDWTPYAKEQWTPKVGDVVEVKGENIWNHTGVVEEVCVNALGVRTVTVKTTDGSLVTSSLEFCHQPKATPQPPHIEPLQGMELELSLLYNNSVKKAFRKYKDKINEIAEQTNTNTLAIQKMRGQ